LGFGVTEEEILAEPSPIPKGAAGLHLLGQICRKTNRRRQGLAYFRLSLQLDPFLWTSFEALCEMGAPLPDTTGEDGIVAHEVFGVPPLHSAPQTAGDEHVSGTPAPGNQQLHVSSNRISGHPRMGIPRVPAGTTPGRSGLATPYGQREDDILPPLRRGHLATPCTSSQPFSTPDLTPILANQSVLDGGQCVPHSVLASAIGNDDFSSIKETIPIQRARKVASGGYYGSLAECIPTLDSRPNVATERKDKPLFGDAEKLSLFEGSRIESDRREQNDEDGDTSLIGNRDYSSSWSKEGRVTFDFATTPLNIRQGSAGISETKEEVDIDIEQISDENEGTIEVLQLMCTMGAAYHLLCQFSCKKALALFLSLPAPHAKTGWVQNQLGRAYFEMADYANAKRSLEYMQTVDPSRLRGWEVLSTTLWHLKQEVDLCYLAQRAVEMDRSSAEAWCVVGNCFSLQKEHETALHFFRRSMQLDPMFTYAYTLSGHEYMANEDFDKAVSCFRHAIKVDERHYNAWYGLGAIFFRQEKYELAEYHFSRALLINPLSSVLLCHLGMVQHANQKPQDALRTLERAFQLDPCNPQASYQRANIWISLNRFEEALEELEHVRDSAPREASVYFTMGKVCKRLGRTEQAMKCFMTALDLDPKDSNMIKAQIDRLEGSDIDEDTTGF